MATTDTVQERTRTLALFDFDGTITMKDTYLDFLRFAVGGFRYVLITALISPLLLCYKLRLISNEQLKEITLQLYFHKWTDRIYRRKAIQYGRYRLPKLIRAEALAQIRWHQSLGHKVVVVTASLEDWLIDWCNKLKVDLVANKIQIENNILTGRLATDNCYGLNKVTRIESEYGLQNYDYIYAYGDSEADREMMALANESFYRAF